ncbi:MAG: hypothetical protein U5L95_01675 [Candidatus Saccharibacteria bacterium]|nr:hypothetical protein [Candidatus Saccharibacteria bacterium]
MNEERFSPRYGEESHDDTQPGRSRFESVVDFLRRSREKDDENEDDDAEKGTRRKKGKSSRWRRFLGRMFGGGEQEADGRSADPERSARAPLISLEPLQAKRQDKAPEEPTPQEAQETSRSESEPALAEESSRPNPSEENPEDNELNSERDTPGISEAEAKRSRGVNPDNETPEEPETQSPNTTLIERNESQTEKDNEQDRGRTGNATGALLALDYLNYRGRKKLERKLESEQREQNKQLRDSKEQLQHQKEQLGAQRTELAAARQRKNAEQKPLEAPREPERPPAAPEVDEKTPAAERTPQSPEEPEVEVVFEHQELLETDKNQKEAAHERVRAENQELIELRKLQEKERDIARQQAQERERLELERLKSQETEKINEELLRSESTFVEKEHERHNEIKDQSQRLAPPTSVASVLQKRQPPEFGGDDSLGETSNVPFTNANAASATDVKTKPPDTKSAGSASATNLYKTAITSGFITAIVLLAAFITAALLF